MQHHEDFGRRLCVSVDAEGYGQRDDRAQYDMQRTLVQILDTAAARAGLDRTTWRRQGVGDEELSLIPLGPDEPRLIDEFPRQLDAELARFNCSRKEDRLRLRMALHVGVAYPADNGYAGQGVVAVSRLLNATPLRRALKLATSANLAWMVSEVVFTDVIRQGHTTLGANDFRQVDIAEKEYQGVGWLRVPGVDVHRLDLANSTTSATSEQPSATPHSSTPPQDAEPRSGPASLVTNVFNREVNAAHGTFGISGGVHG
ncbi:hypothetical protein [Micromonospora sp. NPDC005237]|uniref:hypothetical protein n=1 Tax=Micromonospora sp. NPDC005237 TaxID=3155113 RepID=UPI0033A0EDCB